jgi:pimeloyl-ACP methyl ester carboxylesterase
VSADPIPVDGAALWWRRAGAGQHTPLIVPGAVIDDDLDPLATDRPVVFYDSRNRGRSASVLDPARLGFWVEVADAEAVRAHVGFERASWLGWSYLAGVVVQHAAAHPVRVDRLVLVAPIAPAADVGTTMVFDAPAHGLAGLDQLRAAQVDRTDPRRWCEAWHEVYDPAQVRDPATLRRRRSRPCDHPNEWPSSVTASLAHVFVDLGRYDWRPTLPRVDAPTLVVHGADDDNLEASAAWVASMPHARLLVLDDARRWPWIEVPARFFPAVEQFLAGRWPEGSAG